MIFITPLTEDNKALIEKAYRLFPDDKPISYWEGRMKEGGAFVFEQRNTEGKLVYAGIVEIHDDGIHSVVSGGVDREINFPEIYDFFVYAGKYLNKQYIRATGRIGWWKHLKHRGVKIIDKLTTKQGRLVYIYENKIKEV